MPLLLLLILLIPGAYAQDATQEEEARVLLSELGSQVEELSSLAATLEALKPHRRALISLLMKTDPSNPLIEVLGQMTTEAGPQASQDSPIPMVTISDDIAVISLLQHTDEESGVVVFSQKGGHASARVGESLYLSKERYFLIGIEKTADPETEGASHHILLETQTGEILRLPYRARK